MCRTHMQAPIPSLVMPDSSHITIVPADSDPLVRICDYHRDRLVCQPMYYLQGVPGATADIYVRKTVCDMLLAAASALPLGYKLKIFDAWRPFSVQKQLFDNYYASLLQEFQGQKSEAEIMQMTLLFASYPSEDPSKPFVHSTGGAVDLTIVDPEGNELDMGTAFDDFSDVAHTAYFENNHSPEIRDNRRMLYNVMLAAGFTNFPSEWWHYDYGDRFWAAVTNQNSIYPGIYTEPKHP